MKEETSASTDVQEGVFSFPEKEVQMDHYEILLLIAGTASEEEAAGVFEAAKKEISEATGTITFEEVIGRRALGYTVADSKSGYYFVAEFDMEKGLAAALQDKLRLRKDLERFLMLKKHKKTEEEIAEEKRIRDKIATRRHMRAQERAAEEAAENAEQPVATSSASTPAPAPTPAPATQPSITPTATPAASPDVTKQPATPTETTSPPAVSEPVEKKKRTVENIDEEIEKLLSDDIDI